MLSAGASSVEWSRRQHPHLQTRKRGSETAEPLRPCSTAAPSAARPTLLTLSSGPYPRLYTGNGLRVGMQVLVEPGALAFIIFASGDAG